MIGTPQNKTKISDLGLRFLSAIILGPAVLLLIYLGGLAFDVFITFIICLFLWEWFTITKSNGSFFAVLCGQFGLICVLLLHIFQQTDYVFAPILATSVFFYIFNRLSRSGRWGAEGILYASLALYALLSIRGGANGYLICMFVVLVVWATDIFAYFVGRFIGGPKLWASVSPKKTWSGAIGGVVFSVLASVAFVYLLGVNSLFFWTLSAVCLSIVSQGGDLLESAIKRRFDVKDSGNLIPGHGGIMDRVDGLVAAAVFSVFLGILAGGSVADPMSGFSWF